MLGIASDLIQPEDVLCGKSKQCVNHPGSKRFRVIIESYRERYQACETKYDKMVVTKEVYDSLSQNLSRFLKFDEVTHGWHELDSLAARDKIGHSLRFANRKKRRSTGSRKSGASSVSSSDCSSRSSSRSASPIPMKPATSFSMDNVVDSFDSQINEIDSSNGSGNIDSMIDEWMKLSDKDSGFMTLKKAPKASSPKDIVSLDYRIQCYHQNNQALSTEQQWSFINDPSILQWDEIDSDICPSIFD